MKKILFLIAMIVLLIGCSGKHTYHTYYGDIDTDTMTVAMYDSDSTYCYQVSEVIKDSFGMEYVEYVYFNPQKGIYYLGFPDNTGREVIVNYNPSDNSREACDN
jgi:uncharacterized protein YxeA